MKKWLHIIALGGTICMKNGSSGALECAANAEDLAAAAGLGAFKITCENLAALPSPSLEFEHILRALKSAAKAHAAGASGVVITQGTDTLEESAFFASLFARTSAGLAGSGAAATAAAAAAATATATAAAATATDPQAAATADGADFAIVFTGAMRSPDALGADGPANLHAAAAAALAAAPGVYACFNDRLICAQDVCKRHSAALDAFCAGNAAAVGFFAHGEWKFLDRLRPRAPLFDNDFQICAQIGHFGCTFSDANSPILRAIAEGTIALCGLVIDGFGSGHVHAANADVVGKIAAAMPVIIASRCADGGASTNAYGYAGSEVDLQARGCCMSTALNAQKARILLAAYLSHCRAKNQAFCREKFCEILNSF